jgi:hypothetical protein
VLAYRSQQNLSRATAVDYQGFNRTGIRLFFSPIPISGTSPRRKSVTVKLPLALAQILNGDRHNDYEYDRFIFISRDLDIIQPSYLWIFSPPPLASRTLPHHHRTHTHSRFIFQRSWESSYDRDLLQPSTSLRIDTTCANILDSTEHC